MKSKLLWILFALVTVAHAATSQPGTYPQELKPAPQQAQAAPVERGRVVPDLGSVVEQQGPCSRRGVVGTRGRLHG